MHEKDIKLTVKKQLKTKFPGWKRLSKSRKRELAEQVLEEVMSEYDFAGAIEAPLHELTGVPDVPAGVIPLSEMEEFVAGTRSGLFSLIAPRQSPRQFVFGAVVVRFPCYGSGDVDYNW